MMKKTHSIRLQITAIMSILVAGTVFLCWLLNTTTSGWYYTRSKQKEILDAFYTMNEASAEGRLTSSDFDTEFDHLCDKSNITIMVIQPDRTVVRSSKGEALDLQMQMMEVILGRFPGDTEVIRQTNNYTLEKQSDERRNLEYLILWGTLEQGELILMRVPLASIRESVFVSNRLLAAIGGVAVILGAILVYFVTRKITNPIIELTEISRRMTELDFDVKYNVTGDNEIEQLGSYMNHMSERLEQTISELKSANNELQIDIRKKEEVDEMRKDFISNVSHELKTPLALISGYAEGLQACVQDDPESRDFYCEVIIDEADKMTRMVKKLLTLNQLEFGHETVNMERFDLTELISGVVGNTAILLNQNGIRVQFDENMPMYVWGDEYKVEEVISNYLSNAIHHCEGEKYIRITYTRFENRIRVGFFNTGKQIPKEDLEQVWVKFYKVDKARTREYGGNGIGLSIVKAIMDSFHQQCGVMNHEDGVEFWFELDTESAGNSDCPSE